MDANTILQGPAIDKLKQIDSNSIDLLVTDPPYGYSFMNKDWDKAVVGVDTWKECLRVLKAGAFAFIMSSPRQDVLCKMILNLIEAGFETNFTSLYWCYASGFPKAADVSKLVDKREGAEREVIGKYQYPTDQPKRRQLHGGYKPKNSYGEYQGFEGDHDITKPATPQAKRLQGAYAGFQPKPAVELILVVMKPLSEKTFVDQALANQKGITWLSDVRIPFSSEDDKEATNVGFSTPWSMGSSNEGWKRKTHESYTADYQATDKGRFPANLLVEDDVLNDGSIHKSGKFEDNHILDSPVTQNAYGQYTRLPADRQTSYGDSGSFSRYFSLDAWTEKTLPFLITPKASREEKNRGLNCYMTVKLSREECLSKEENTAAVRLLEKVTSGTAPVSFNIGESGESITALFPKDSLSTISTAINKIIESRILDLLTHSLTSDYTQDANLLMGNGSNLAASVEMLKQSLLTITNGSTGLALGASRVAVKMLRKINASEHFKDYNNSHATVKPLQLMSYLITMGSREGDTVLDPFCGSGTVLIAARQLARDFIGIEISPEYVQIANSRLKPYLAQTRLL